MKTLFKNSIPLIALLLVMSCGKDAAKGGAAASRPALSLPVVKLPLQTVTTYKSYPTSIEGLTNSEVRAKISGYITGVFVDEGQKVKKGQLLFKLETQSMNQDAAAAKANVNAAQVEVEKLKPLVAKNIISAVQLETAKAKLAQAKSGYSGIAATISYGTIKSPVDGYVGSVRLRKGSLVSPNDQQPLTTVSDVSNVYAYYSMNEKAYLNFLQSAEGASKADKIKNFPKVTLILANGYEYDQKGTIETINSQINPNSGTISFRALFKNDNGLLTNGNSGIIKVPTVFEDVVVVPQEATFEQQEGIFVYKVEDDNTATAQAITIKAKAGSLYIVDSGIKANETIVVKGIGKLRSGMPIQPKMVNFDSIAKPITKEFQ
ncbi:efflux RND transporter periplasmic adaptor subunit [Bizionia gelidisalsuginis]|uniref:Efflux RND transporter periplasmic adaptor subunit n=1 Tax=Bizionia gelidisalsuginis TaxID=291188 RepID=A0ABY3MA07_9FLAO|nr:efflux RND transporter periplasmic adaptor subunit [Bizionia gelidisalsuginis]TYC12079.1 efflux RND transporter periplasmic adaptor subunit [Bizionia gelidisalsuginis]